MAGKFTVILAKNARKDLLELDRVTRKRAVAILQQLSADPHHNVIKLKGKDETLFRARAGDYRIVFQIASASIEVMRIAHRKDIYRR